MQGVPSNRQFIISDHGWLGVLAVGDEDNEDVDEVAIFCPAAIAS